MPSLYRIFFASGRVFTPNQLPPSSSDCARLRCVGKPDQVDSKVTLPGRRTVKTAGGFRTNSYSFKPRRKTRGTEPSGFLDTMQVTFCRLRTRQWCFIVFNVLLFHALLFGADFIEEYFLQAAPFSYTDAKFMEIRERARNLDARLMNGNVSESYLISGPDLCSGRDVFLLSVVFSDPENKTRRDVIRRTWGNVTAFKGRVVLTIFALGRPVSEFTQSEVTNESRIHRDIVEGRFLDAYRNETLKMIMVMKWAVTFCPNVRFILKTDQSMFVNINSLADHLLGLDTNSEDLYTGRVVHQSVPDRNPGSLNFIPWSSYPEAYYPDYCGGSAMVVSQDVARKVYLVSKEVPTSVPSDAFIGICAEKAGVLPVHSARFSGSRHIRYNRCCYEFIFSSLVEKDEELSLAWKDMTAGEECTIMKTYYGLVSCKVWAYIDKFSYFNKDETKHMLSF
ncbi:beta-1,3-galactosyltransferase 9 [Spea bombifrons]|uniref:beta-1,3-galactosyltransferase 9 n=1 Tax=Spea bombifrons TaxID=233779 RepID=UPI00234BA513|nr:beta-1,3-galactosyltransferase 9 [Spea bombifrons]